MRWLLDLLYLLAAAVTAPIWLTRMIRTGKIRTDWLGRFGRATVLSRSGDAPRVLLHAVSVGEVNAIRLLVEQLVRDCSGIQIVIATTTDTGHRRAADLFADRHTVVRYPLDFSFAVERFLNVVRPDAVALVELEVWPNFCAACRRRGIPVCIVNGRLTQRSFKRYRWIKPLLRRCFAQLRFAAVQNADYAERFRAMGVHGERLHITGTMKWDTAQIADEVPGASQLAADMGIDRDRPLIVAGSTAPGEHELLVQAVPNGVQLLCAPRKPEWFDQAAAALAGCVRRSAGQPSPRHSSQGRERALFLLDTIGELRQAYALADIVVIGRSFGTLHGSDMMEPVALGKPTVVGPAVADFQDTTDALLTGEGIIQTDPAELAAVLQRLLDDPALRKHLAENGRAVIRAQQGATARNAQLLQTLLPAPSRGVPPQGAKNSPFQREAETAKEKKEERTW
jgi:3-deoxy-D-manno-octulosonic-acid transferase